MAKLCHFSAAVVWIFFKEKNILIERKKLLSERERHRRGPKGVAKDSVFSKEDKVRWVQGGEK